MAILAKLLGRKSGGDIDISTVTEEESENRTTDRRGAYKVAVVTYPTGYVRKGVVVDLSPSGARVRFSQRGEVPPHIAIKIESIAGERGASVIWQENHDIGVKFDT